MTPACEVDEMEAQGMMALSLQVDKIRPWTLSKAWRTRTMDSRTSGTKEAKRERNRSLPRDMG